MAVFLFWVSALAIVAMFILIPVFLTMILKDRPGRRTPGVDVQTHEYRGGKRVPPRPPARVIRLDQVRHKA